MPTTTDLITSFTWEFYADACQRTPPQHTWFHLARMQLRTAHTHKHTANAYTEIKTVLKSRHRQIFLQNIRLHMPCHATSLCTVIWNELFSEHSLFAAFICISKSLLTICKYFHVIAVPDQMHEALKKTNFYHKVTCRQKFVFAVELCVSLHLIFASDILTDISILKRIRRILNDGKINNMHVHLHKCKMNFLYAGCHVTFDALGKIYTCKFN